MKPQVWLFCILFVLIQSKDIQLDPTCGNDCAKQFMNALVACEGSPSCHIDFAPGQYHFILPPSAARIDAHNLTDLQITGSGATIILHGKIGFLYVEYSNKVTISGLTIDMFRPPFTYGQVVNKTSNSFTLNINIDQYPFPSGTNWTWLYQVQSILDYDPTANCIAQGSIDVYELTNPVRLTYQDSSHTVTVMQSYSQIYQGHWYILRHQVYSYNAFHFWGCSDVYVIDVTINTIPGMGIIGEYSRDITLTRVHVEPKLPRPMSICSDGTHFTLCFGTVTIIDSVFEGQGDDGLNINGRYATISQLINARQLKSDVSNYLLSFYGLGKQVLFRDRQTMKELGTNTIVAFDKNSLTVSFQSDLPSDLKQYDLIGTATDFARLVSTGNVYKCNRARGNLLKVHDMLIQNNTYQGITGAAIQTDPDGVNWFESGSIVGLTIRDSTFAGNNYGIARQPQAADIYITAFVPIFKNGVPTDQQEDLATGQIHQNIEISNNKFVQEFGQAAVSIHAGSNIKITDNLISFSETPKNNIFISNSVADQVTGNSCTENGKSVSCVIQQ